MIKFALEIPVSFYRTELIPCLRSFLPWPNVPTSNMVHQELSRLRMPCVFYPSMQSMKRWEFSLIIILLILIHVQAQTKAQAWKVVHYFWWWCPSVRTYVLTYVHSVRTKHNKPIRVPKPLFKLVLLLVLGRGSLYDSSLAFSRSTFSWCYGSTF